jgi:Protein of unknown function (DUF2971)
VTTGLKRFFERANRSEASRYLARNANFSPFLYKFQAPRSRSLKGIIVHSQLWLASVKSFNDPFEMKARVTFEGSPKVRAEYFRQLAKRNVLTFKKREAFVLEQMTSQRFVQRAQPAYDSMTPAFGVCCFASRGFTTVDRRRAGARNILMWSHYAASHTGVCFQFHVSRSALVLGLTVPVEYDDALVTINWAEQDTYRDKLGQALLRKTKAWSYEHERRLIERNRANSGLACDPSALQGIIIGCAASRATELRIVALCRRRQAAHLPKPKLYRAATAEDAYALKLNRARDLEDLVSRPSRGSGDALLT